MILWREEYIGRKIGQDATPVIHQVIKALEWGGHEVNKNKGILLTVASKDESIKCGASLGMDDKGDGSKIISKS